MEKRYDLLGKEVQVGDDVIIIEPHHHKHVYGVITKFTPKGFKVTYYRYSLQRFEEIFVGSVIKGED